MAVMDEISGVVVAAGGWPAAFCWNEERYLVRILHGVRVVRGERRFRVLTAQGPFELGLQEPAGRWLVRRAPRWFERLSCELRFGPRYPLPPGSRARSSVQRAVAVRQPECRDKSGTGARYADGFAVVR